MFKSLIVGVLVVSACAVGSRRVVSAQDMPQPTVSIRVPTSGSAVGYRNRLTAVCTNAAGLVPVVFVRPLAGSQPAWVQPRASLRGSNITGEYYCGDLAGHGIGEKFRLSVVLLDPSSARGYTEGQRVASVPTGRARAEVVVTRR